MIIASAVVGVGHKFGAFAADHGADLGMCLEVKKAINHMCARAFQATRLADVCRLVEASFQLDKGGDGFAVFCCFAKRFDDGRIFGCAVQCLFDRYHVWVKCRLFQKAHHHVEGLVGVV